MSYGYFRSLSLKSKEKEYFLVFNLGDLFFTISLISISNNSLCLETEYCYTDADIDYFYTEYNGQGYLVLVNKGGKKDKTLRFFAKQNHSTIMWAKDFTLEKILKEELNYNFENSTWSNTVLTR